MFASEEYSDCTDKIYKNLEAQDLRLTSVVMDNFQS